MSREIDLSDPSKLSDADKRYLQDRNRLPHGVNPVPVDQAFSELGPMTKPEPERVNPEATAGSAADDDDSAYDTYNVEQLKAELTNRGLAVSGKRAELVARLEEDDNTVIDDDDEDDEDEEEDE